MLRQCLRQAWEFELIDANPMDRVPKLRWQLREWRYWTIAQTVLATGQRWGLFFAFLATSGLRFSEAIGLGWSDVNWQTATVRVAETPVWDGESIYTLLPKTKAGSRHVSLPCPAMQALRTLAQECPPEMPIFRTATGAPPRHADMRLYLHAQCDVASLVPYDANGSGDFDSDEEVAAALVGGVGGAADIGVVRVFE